MLTFTSFILQNATAGLLALLGLAVPVAIHLWNRRPERTVQVGSVRWLAAAANQRLRNLRLEQVGLLLLRATVLALLALAVAQPLWLRSLLAAPVRGVVLLAPNMLRPDVLPALRPTVDSLRRRGFALRLFAPGFRAVSSRAWSSADSLAKLAATPAPTLSTAAETGLEARPAALADDYWARARQAADSFPDQPLHIVSGTARRHFVGPRPALPARLTWQPVPLPDSVVWLAGAALIRPDTLRLLVGRSQEDATTYRLVRWARPGTAAPLAVPGLPGLRYQPAQSGRAATVGQPNGPLIPVVDKPLRVLLYADAAHAESGRYVRAALQAAAIGLAQRLEIRTIPPNAAFRATAPPDWLFWLSEKPAPPGWRAQVRLGTQLWQEAAGAGAKVETELDLTGLATTAPPVFISRLDTTSGLVAGTVLWQDGTGRPVLTRQPNGPGYSYQFLTRLQPTWNGLPDSPALPELLLAFLRPASASPDADVTQDLRQLDARQLAAPVSLASAAGPATDAAASHPPALNPKKASPVVAGQTIQATDLRAWAALAALVLFGLERWLAGRRAAVSSLTST